MSWKKLKNCSKIFSIFLLLTIHNLALGQQVDTIHINLDSLTADDGILEIDYNISEKYCGSKLHIPIVLRTTSTSKVYSISNFLGNGDSCFLGKTGAIISSKNTVVNWHLLEHLYGKDCKSNRKWLYGKLDYTSLSKDIGGINHQKKIKINYHYIE